VRLIVEIEAVGDELFELDVDGSIEGASASAAEVGTAAFATVAAPVIAARATFGAWTTVTAFAAAGAWAAITAWSLGRSGTCPTGAIAFAFFSALFRTRAAVALGTRLGCWCRGLLLGSLHGCWGFLRLRSFEIFCYGLHFV
jgi:hypothetical protein